MKIATVHLVNYVFKKCILLEPKKNACFHYVKLFFYCNCLKADFNSFKTEKFKWKRGPPWLQEDKNFNCCRLDFNKSHFFFLSVCFRYLIYSIKEKDLECWKMEISKYRWKIAIDDLCCLNVSIVAVVELWNLANQHYGGKQMNQSDFGWNIVRGSKRRKSLQAFDEWFISCFWLVYSNVTAGFLSQSQCLAIQTKVITLVKVVDHCSVHHYSQSIEAVSSSVFYLRAREIYYLKEKAKVNELWTDPFPSR